MKRNNKKRVIIFSIVFFFITSWCVTGGIIIFNTTNIYLSTYLFDNEKFMSNFSFDVQYKHSSIGIPFVLDYVYTKNPLIICFRSRDDQESFSGLKIYKLNIKYGNEKPTELIINKVKNFKNLNAFEKADLNIHRDIAIEVEIKTPDLERNNIDTIEVYVSALFLDKESREIPFNVTLILEYTKLKYTSTSFYELSQM